MRDFPCSIRPETLTDVQAIRQVLEVAFGRQAEADLVEALRRRGLATLSLVALQAGRVIGHLLFSPVTIESPGASLPALGLGPLAVLPECQRQGVGAALIRPGLIECRAAGHLAVVVVGHPDYYGRFGLVTAARLGLTCEFDLPENFFLALELTAGALRGQGGTVFYQPEFRLV